ncbi:MAG: EAL domain-containing protein [Acidobacteria bacterium]|nr:EAL domain-containing protein [Acidobacteriota bacterium]
MRDETFIPKIPEVPKDLRELLHYPRGAESSWVDRATVEIDISRLEGAISSEYQSMVQMALDNSVDGVVIITPPDETRPPRVRFVNSTFTRITGMNQDDVLGRELEVFRVPESDEAVRDALLHPLCQRRSFEGEATALRKNGTRYTLRLTMVPIHGDGELVDLWVAYLRDVSEQKAQIASLEHQALHDVLTNLPNRALLLQRLDEAIERAKVEGELVGLLVMDLDRFKEVNDTFGHHYGDKLLQQVADRLREELRGSQTVARMGGDEFALVLPSIDDTGETVRTARRLINALQYPFEIEEQRFEVGTSVGIALFPEHGDDATTLLRRADASMYRAKREGIGFSVFTADLENVDPQALSLGVELRQAIDNGMMELYYQPKIHLRTGTVTGVEALARWNNRDGMVLPDLFIPLAERTGLIGHLTDWAIDAALQQCREWQDRDLVIPVAVNISGKSFHEHVLPQNIFQKLQQYGLEPNQLKIEITESSVLDNPPQALAILSLLQSLGIRLSLDDFGTGYSSLTHLRQLPVDEIKIDKSFVMGMSTSEGDAAIVRTLIDLAHSLGRQVVAEGVADDETCRALYDLGCDVAQGYCFTPPLPADRLIGWLERNDWGRSVWNRIITPSDEDGKVFR